MARVAVVVGTRPEAIKLASVIRALHSYAPKLQTMICATGQHRELLDQAMADMSLRADRNLNLMTERQALAGLLARAIAGIDEVFRDWEPDMCVVQGDTTSALAGALVAYLSQTPVAHVEAGLRSGDPLAPFPEEANRRMISQLARLHFAPTRRAAEALVTERVPSLRITVTGNTVIDSLLWARKRLATAQEPAASSRMLLVTLHRRETFGKDMEAVCRAILGIVVSRSDVRVLFPVHPSPSVRQPVRQILGEHPRIELSEPLPYRELVGALVRCHFVLTDSGGIQEEAPSLGKPVLVLRNATEREEGLVAGTASLIGTDPRRIMAAALRLLDDDALYLRMSQAKNPYGDGLAGGRIAHAIAEELGVYAGPPPTPFVAPSGAVKDATAVA